MGELDSADLAEARTVGGGQPGEDPGHLSALMGQGELGASRQGRAGGAQGFGLDPGHVVPGRR